MHSWIQEFGIKTETGQKLDFHEHRYLFDIYSDNSPYLCCLKAGQIGFSTLAILKTIWMTAYQKLDLAYILPTVEMVQKFVGSKVNRLAQQNPIIQELMKDKDSITQKQIGENYIHYLGAQTERSAIMLSLDMLVADEYDKAPQNILETYDSRLQHSKKGYKWVFSNPTAPDFGVDRFWKLSDQKKWFVRHACGSEILLDENAINYQLERFECPKCHEEITNEERRMGEWKKTAEGDWSGYWIPLWLNPKVTAKVVANYKRTKTGEYFSNFVCGWPYIGGGNKVNASTIIQCLSPDINDQSERVIIGVDTGLPIHFVLANKNGYFYYGKCSDPKTGKDPYDDLDRLLARFPASILVSDQGGDLIGIRKLQAKYPGRVFLCWYRADQKTQEIIRWGEGEEYGKVIVDRNRAIQMFIGEMEEKRVTFNGNESEWQEYISHWMNIYRVWEVDEAGLVDKTRGFKWERQGPDHFAHATIYARIGLDKFSKTKASIVEPDFLSDLPRGRIFRDE
jgi:hypothetical protein